MIYRKATEHDIKDIVSLLIEDELGKAREVLENEVNHAYLKAFAIVEKDPNQYLMVVEKEQEIIGTCHLTIMPSLTFKGTIRMQIEGVRIAAKMRGQNIGELMIQKAIEYGKSRDVGMVQLMTNKQRPRAKHFYEKIGFEAIHEGS
jgi:N-acetylglutamate synthase-like GNAT family acetyltransferase